ncbi:unnamed protein product [Caenorhabditis sp. 36 PRJEB53466]|nr:unnamed protein product [Caenorhabditis sp. 36 PRJEB53466]
MKTFLILALFAGAAAAEFIDIGYKACKSEGTVSAVKAEGCELVVREGKKVCVFKKETKPVIQIHFKPSKNSDSLKTSIRAKVGTGGALVDFPQKNTDACKFGVKCPLVAGENQIFEQAIVIASSHPEKEIIQVNWQLTRPNDDKEACIIFLAEIVA